MNGLISRSEGVATQILKLYLPTIPRLHTNGTDTMKKTFIACAIFTALVLFLIPGCTEDTVSVPPGFNVSSVSVSVAPNGDIIVTISGGTTPYSITAASDTTVATTSVAGGSLNIHGVSGGFTTVTVGEPVPARLAQRPARAPAGIDRDHRLHAAGPSVDRRNPRRAQPCDTEKQHHG